MRPTCTELRFKREETVYLDEASGLTTQAVEFTADRGMTWETALGLYEREHEGGDGGGSGGSGSFTAFYTHTNDVTGLPQTLLAIERNEKVSGRSVSYNIYSHEASRRQRGCRFVLSSVSLLSAPCQRAVRLALRRKH